jgi:hypothetical protein
MAAIRASLFTHYPDQVVRLVTHAVDLISFMDCYLPSVALTTVRIGKVYIALEMKLGERSLRNAAFGA